MKRVVLLALVAAAAAGAQAQSQGFVDRARVQGVEPQYEQVQVPRNECSSQWVTEQQRPQTLAGGYGGAIVGGVAGGILGRQVGKGSGREVATAAGAVIGAIAGDRISSYQPQYAEQAQREVRNCRTVNDVQSRINGYRVTYEYRGHQYVSVMRDQPGSTVPVRVSVTPVEEREYYRPQ